MKGVEAIAGLELVGESTEDGEIAGVEKGAVGEDEGVFWIASNKEGAEQVSAAALFDSIFIWRDIVVLFMLPANELPDGELPLRRC